MSFEILYALQVLGAGVDPYMVNEALDNYEVTVKRNAVEILKDLGRTVAIKELVAKIDLFKID